MFSIFSEALDIFAISAQHYMRPLIVQIALFYGLQMKKRRHNLISLHFVSHVLVLTVPPPLFFLNLSSRFLSHGFSTCFLCRIMVLPLTLSGYVVFAQISPPQVMI